MTLYMFFSRKLYEKIERISPCIQSLFKEVGSLCENYMRYDAKRLSEDPQSFITM